MMKKFRRSSICRLLSCLAVMMFVLTSAPVTLFAQASASSGTVESLTKIKHEPIKYFVVGKRIKIAAEVTDPEGIKLVRCYFKGKEQADFVFVAMTAGNNTYTAILPAAAQTSSSIDYLFLAVNNKNQVVKTQQFRMNKDDSQPTPPWQDVAMEGQLNVSTELAQAPAVLEGFADSIVMDVVESAMRFGFVVGEIYAVTQVAAAGGATGTAATATSAGTVTAATGAGLSTAAIIGIAAGVAVTAGVVGAAAGGSKSSGSGGSSGGGGGSTTVTSRNVQICVTDYNSVQDDYYDLYVNGTYKGPANNVVGGTTCYSATLVSGNNTILLRLTTIRCCGTGLTITANPGGWSQAFGGTYDHTWIITAP